MRGMHFREEGAFGEEPTCVCCVVIVRCWIVGEANTYILYICLLLQQSPSFPRYYHTWIPAFAGMTLVTFHVICYTLHFLFSPDCEGALPFTLQGILDGPPSGYLQFRFHTKPFVYGYNPHNQGRNVKVIPAKAGIHTPHSFIHISVHPDVNIRLRVRESRSPPSPSFNRGVRARARLRF